LSSSNFLKYASFSGHESFGLRYLWLKKGYDAICADPEFFHRDDAMVVLGVGKNMVRSIRHWGLACQVWTIEERSNLRALAPTELGRRMFHDSGWDPYLEDVASIWWLHHQLITSEDKATTWAWAFSRPKSNRFTRELLISELLDIGSELSTRRPGTNTIKRDVDVLLRSYVVPEKNLRASRVLEDDLDSPLVNLKLLRETTEKGTYELVSGAHPTLPDAILEAAVVSFVQKYRPAERSVNLDMLAYSPLSPGRIFRLSEDALAERISRLTRTGYGQYVFDETAGLRQLLLPRVLPEALEIIERYYSSTTVESVA
jgi:hypothetical protein